MSLTPGFILADDACGHMGLSLSEIAAIVGEWERAHALPLSERSDSFVVKGEVPALVIRWDRYTKRPVLCVRRGQAGDDVYVYDESIAEMRQVLAGQVAP